MRHITPKDSSARGAVRDSLTRAAFERAVPARAATAGREDQGLPIVMLRVDRMGTALETYGERAWDRTVELIGQVINATIGPRDMAALYDRDRFIVMLSQDSRPCVESLVGRIRDAIEQANARGDHPIPVTVSIGVAMGEGTAGLDLVARAEAALPTQPSASIMRDPGLTSLAPPIITPIADRPVILIVDDDAMVAAIIRDSLAGTNAQTLTAGRVDEALALLHREKVDVVITDIHLPGASGFEMLAQIQTIDASIVVIVITGSRDLDLAVKVIRSGADDFLMKPFTPDDLRASVTNSLRKRQMILNGRAYQALLKSQVQQHAQDLQQTLRHLETTYRETLKALGAALDTRDIETHAHSERVAQYALTLGRVIGMTVPELTTLERGVYLHDIGKIGVPDHILLKHGALTDDEWHVMRKHPLIGYRLASRIEFLKGAAKIILSHHERFDGTGYPYALKGASIPLGARVFALVDALDAITSDRPYRKAKPFNVAREEIAKHSGSQFDPLLIEAFMSVPDSAWTQIRQSVTCQVESSPQVSEQRLLEEGRLSLTAESDA
jgi:diguanylate cyclase (GGDEF)-like protein